jgi:hypothetical protein
VRLRLPVGTVATASLIESSLLGDVAPALRPPLATFFAALHGFYIELAFTYLEINPIVVLEGGMVTPLDLAAKVSKQVLLLNSLESRCSLAAGAAMHTPLVVLQGGEWGRATQGELSSVMSSIVPEFVKRRSPNVAGIAT